MKSCGFIDEETYQTESKKELSCTTTKNKNEYSDYVWAVFNELEELQIDPYTLKEGCVVQTYCNKELQKTIASYTFPCDHAVLVSDTQTAGIQAFLSTNQNGRRQPGSAIKPLLVYAPAIDKNLITPYTKILDEPIRYGTYAPENYDKKYHGKVSVSTALAQSYNVPAVKILNQLTLKTAEDYAKKMQIPLDSTDKNLALALGGMNYGTTLQELCDGYTVFANGGNYQKSRFIKKITDKNQNVLYEASHKTTRVFEEGTASLLNEMLIETAKIGTAKKLKDLPFQIAAKTGTNGNSEGNLDAYTIGYTSQNTVGIWLGDNENKRLEVKGSDCCKYVKDIMQTLYLPNSNNENNQSTQKNTTNQNEETSRLKLNNHLPPCLETHKGTKEIMIDKEEFKQNDKMVLCDEICPFKNKLTIKVKSGTEPTTQSTKFQHPTIQNPQITVKDNKIILLLYQTEYYAYLINRQNNEEIVLIYDGNWQKEITDEPPCGTYSYTITPYYSYQGQNYYGETLTLPPVNLSNSNSENSSPQKIPDILSHDWFQE
jgi:membrane peptidoglycan carboxypeptidase